MPFDESLDKVLHVDCVPGDQKARNNNIEFKVASYDGGVPKLQLTRVGFDGIHSKLGRMTMVEIERVRDKITEILNIKIDEEEAAPEGGDAASAEGSGEGGAGKSHTDDEIPF